MPAAKRTGALRRRGLPIDLIGRVAVVTGGSRGLHSDCAASKGAIISFTKSLATELGPHGILVNAVAPWWVDTDMSRDTLDHQPPREARSARTAPAGSGADAMKEIAATPAILMPRSPAARSGVIPPMAHTGIRTPSTTLRRASAPWGGPKAALPGVSNTGPKNR